MRALWDNCFASLRNSPQIAPAHKDYPTTVEIEIDNDDRDRVVSEYELKLWTAKQSALLWLSIYKLTHFLRLCTVTWSTVLLLGGFAAELPHTDFYVIVILLLLDVGRFASALFFSELVRKDLISNSQNPRHLNFKDIRHEITSLLHFLFPVVQIIFAIPSICLPLWRLLVVASQSASSNLAISIRLFLLLVLCNALLTTWHHSRFFTSKHFSDVKIQRYFDELIWRGLHISLAQADDLNVFEFSFLVQARDYRCNVQREVVEEAYRDFFRYLLAHRNGLQIVSTYLDSEDCFKQQAAANIVGFWCHLHNPNLKRSLCSLSTAFLKKLFRKTEMRSQVGWDAANSLTFLVSTFKVLSRDALVKICKLTSSDDKGIVEFLTGKLDPNDSWSICYLHLLAALFQHVEDRSLISLTEAQKERVKEILCNDNSRSRAKTYAAYALLKAGKALTSESIDRILVSKQKDAYFHAHEVYMLDCIRQECDLKSLEESDWRLRGFEIRGDWRSLSPFFAPLPQTSIRLSCGNQVLDKGKASLHSSALHAGTLTTFRQRLSLAYSHCWLGYPRDAKST